MNKRVFAVKTVVAFFVICMTVFVGVNAQARDLSAQELQIFSQNDILFYDPGECVAREGTNGSTLEVTGDLADIMNAKNAEKSFFAGSGNIDAPKWSDSNKASMKKLLENYGDLAYRLGKAVGAPYVAILVQMRYEDSNSVCGKNNFWGNGCPPSRAYKGGATIQGENLGEGFVQYGQTLLKICEKAQNVANEEECLNSLRVSDPKTYLTRVGPLWVQGDANGPGYGSIEAQKKSVDALQAYIDSAEGQEIVKTFGGGSGASGATSGATETAASSNGVSGSSGGGNTCAKLGEMRTAMWNAASQSDKEHFMQVVTEEDPSIAGVEGYMNQIVSKHGRGNDGTLAGWLSQQCPAFRGGRSCSESHTITAEEQGWIDQALAGSNNIKFAIGNATGGSGVGAGKIVCVWDGSKCRDDVDYNVSGGLGKCKVYSPSYSFGECWGLEGEDDWAEEMSQNCGSSGCGGNDAAELQRLVEEWAWPTHGPGSSSGKDAYKTAIQGSKYTGSCSGEDCGAFVYNLMVKSGWDPDYSASSTFYQARYLDKSEEWEDVTSQISSNDDAQPGDVIICNRDYGHNCTGSSHHVLVFVGEIPGFSSQMASASQCGRWPEADYYTDISHYVSQGYHIFRKKGSGGGSGSCEVIDYCEDEDVNDSSMSTSDNILENVQKLIDLANQNGSKYEYGGSGRSIARFDKVLNEGDVNVIDCTGFASEVYYMTYKDEFKQSDIFYSNGIINGEFSSYKEVDRSEVRPGDIFAYNGHGGIVIEAENGVVTKIAETGGKGGRSGKNENIGYSDSSDYSVRKMNTSAGHFFRWKGAE